MRKRFAAGLIGAAATFALLAAQPAAAATEIGSDCQATSGASGYTFVQLKRVSGGSLPIAAPSAGVVTKWKVNSAVPTPVGQKLQILRPTGNPNEFQTVAESTPGTVSVGLNSFDTRLPIEAGDRPAAAGAPGGMASAPLYCSTANPEDEMGTFAPESTLGSTNTYAVAPGLVAAISAIVEPDADGDGYGDETQDKCPQSAAVQSECPVVLLDSYPVPKRNAVLVIVGTSTDAPVTVSATVRLPKAKKKAKASATARLKKVTSTVTPGKLGRFVLKFPGNLKRALKSLPKGKKLTLKITATATNVAGQVSKDGAKLRLRGQLKAKVKKG